MLTESLRTRGIIVEAGFIPQPIKIDKQAFINFQAGVEEFIELTEIQKGNNFIHMSNKNDSGESEIRIQLNKEKISIHALFPNNSVESMIDLFDSIIKLAGELVGTQIFVPLVINIRKQISTKEKDARVYFGENLLRLSTKQQEALGRPIQTIGIKLMLPPFINDNSNNATDGIELKIETLNEDLRDIYIEIHRIFSNPIPIQSFHSIKNYIVETDQYVVNNIINFLSDNMDD